MVYYMRIYEEQLQLRLLFTLRDTAGKRACLHAHLPANATSSRRGSPSCSIMRYGRPPDYLIAFNIGAIWNVIFKWVERGMEESLDNVRGTLETYLRRVSQGL